MWAMPCMPGARACWKSPRPSGQAGRRVQNARRYSPSGTGSQVRNSYVPYATGVVRPGSYSKRKNLGTGGLDEEIREFMRGFRSAESYGEKLVLIDTLIHRFHWGSDEGRPLATALIEGKMKDIMPFLDRLSYGDGVPEEATRTREEWRRKWADNPWSKGRGQRPKRRSKDGA